MPKRKLKATVDETSTPSEPQPQQQTIPGCEIENVIQREERFKGLLANLNDRKIIVEAVLKRIKLEEKNLNDQILKCLNERNCPLLLQMQEWCKDGDYDGNNDV